MSVGTVVRTKSGKVFGRVVEVNGPRWFVEWEDGRDTWSDSRLLLLDGQILSGGSDRGQGMRVYVAGRTSEIERVQRIQRMFTDRGHTITFDWTGEDGEIRTGWRGTTAETRGHVLAHRERSAVRAADLVVLCWRDGDGTRAGMVGALIEVGMGLADGTETWVLNPSRDSVFFCLPEVSVLSSDDEVAARLDEMVGWKRRR